MNSPRIGIVIGSESDLPIMKEACSLLKELGIPYEITVSSAHRTPEATSEYARTAQSRGLKVIIAAAGGAAHLAGAIASRTLLPVIGVPLSSTSLGGIDSLLSTVQMPSGIPVATMAVGKAGAMNAALLAAQILALDERDIHDRLESYRRKMEEGVKESSRKIGSSSGLCE